eukprot:TRINITY_DN18220_c0_g1_i1.p1 TRINITY_DN18220_c0_g1~~TRINITY_DN18220_c0_g1_i1.p1  ORF type:complete len:482 (-),score=125.52 TRINITY_DN18220_c0_g1_i1:64-1455(-)
MHVAVNNDKKFLIDPKITHLALEEHQDKKSKSIKFAKYFSEALKLNTTITSLIFTNYKFQSEGMKDLFEALSANCTLTKLNISGNNIGPDGAKIVSYLMLVNTTLKDLDISYNAIGVGALHIADSLRMNEYITKLSLAGSKMPSDGIKSIVKSLKTNTTLKKLNLDANFISGTEIQYLIKYLKTNSTLTSLSINSNDIGMEDAHLFNELLQCKHLYKLKLEETFSSPEMMKVFFKDFHLNSVLRSIYVGKNRINSQGVQCLLDNIVQSSTLQELHLNYNKIDYDGIGYVAKYLKQNSYLKTLNLSFNMFGPIGAKYISEALFTNNSLKKLVLDDNLLRTDGMRSIAQAFLVNSSLTFVSLRRNRFLDVNQTIYKSLINNYTIIHMEPASKRVKELCDRNKDVQRVLQFPKTFNFQKNCATVLEELLLVLKVKAIPKELIIIITKVVAFRLLLLPHNIYNFLKN